MRIFNPKANDIWFTGETRTIVWRQAFVPPPPVPRTLNITLRRASDPSFAVPIARDYPLKNFMYQWKIPTGLANADDYIIRVIPNRLYPRPGRPNIMASKSKPFTIVSKRNVSKCPYSAIKWFQIYLTLNRQILYIYIVMLKPWPLTN